MANVTLSGMGMLAWKVRWILGPPETYGSARLAAIGARAQELGLDWLAVKIADGPYAYNVRPPGIDDVLPAFVETLEGAGVIVAGWQYIYGRAPVQEARKAAERVRKFGLKAMIVDAEAEYKQPGMEAPARVYMRELRGLLPDIPIWLCSYRYPAYHRELPWRAFLEHADGHMPQVYWMGAHNAGWQLRESIRQIRALETNLGIARKPILPVGAAFREHGWQPTPAEMVEFHGTAQDLAVQEDIRGVSWWHWGAAEELGMGATLQKLDWAVAHARIYCPLGYECPLGI